MAAISYSWTVGQTLEQVTTSTNAPSGGAGTIELRIDQTASTVTDGSIPRPINKSEVLQAMIILEQYFLRDTNIYQG